MLLHSDPLLRDRLIALMRAIGVELHVERTLDDAGIWLATHHADIILLGREIGGEAALPHVAKWRQGDPFRWQSIVMLGDHHGAFSEAEALHGGCDSFVAQPFTPDLLYARVAALIAACDLRRTAERQRIELAAFRDNAESEAELARFLLSRLSRSESLDQAGISYHWVPADLFSGDLIAVAHSSAGDLYGLLADATGHGLAAAINLIPLTSAFHAMAAKGFNLLTIGAQLNQVVQEYSLADRFVAVTLARFIHREALLEVLNAGNPAALLVSASRGVVREFSSGSVPLGILGRGSYKPRVETVELVGDESLVLYSDGLIEAGNSVGEAWGKAALHAQIAQALETATPLVEAIRGALEQHCATRAPADDISLLVMQAPHIAAPSLDGKRLVSPGRARSAVPVLADPLADPKEQGAATSHLEFGFSSHQLQRIDVVPVIVGITRAIGVSRRVESRLFTIVSELFANALEHGLLGLNSRLKGEVDGFERYLALRMERLTALTEGAITVRIEHSLLDSGGGRIRIGVADSGPGFDHQHYLHMLATCADESDIPLASGRGLALLFTLCDRVEFNAIGNEVQTELVYT